MSSPYDQIRADVTAAQAADQALAADDAAQRQQVAALTAEVATLEAELHPTPPPAAGPAWGANIGTDIGKLTQVDTKMGGINAARFYWSQKPLGTKATCRYPTATDLGGNLGNRILVPSFKLWPQDVLAGMYDADILALAKACPPDTITLPDLWHEMEDQVEKGAFTAAQFIAAHRKWATILRSVGNPNIQIPFILMGFTYNGGHGRDWRTFYPGNDYVDVMCADEYAWAPNNPADLSTMFVKGRAAADSVGKPFSVTETGVDPATFGNGQARYDALTTVAKRVKAASNGPVALYFGADPTLTGNRWDITTDPRALAAWKAGQTG